MSGPNPEGAAPAKKPVSPLRNAIGLIALVAVSVIGFVEVNSKYQFSAAVTALNKRSEDENKDLMTEKETNALLGRQPDRQGVDVGEMGSVMTRKTYTWPSLTGRRVLTAYFTKQSDPRLHHYETPGATKPADRPSTPAGTPVTPGALPSAAFAPPSAPGTGAGPRGPGAGPARKKAPETPKAPETKSEPAPPDAKSTPK
jgi:hypothetical protein